MDKLCQNHHRFNLLVSNKKFPTKVGKNLGYVTEILFKKNVVELMVPCDPLALTNPLRFWVWRVWSSQLGNGPGPGISGSGASGWQKIGVPRHHDFWAVSGTARVQQQESLALFRNPTYWAVSIYDGSDGSFGSIMFNPPVFLGESPGFSTFSLTTALASSSRAHRETRRPGQELGRSWALIVPWGSGWS